jgi:hypothetical protein
MLQHASNRTLPSTERDAAARELARRHWLAAVARRRVGGDRSPTLLPPVTMTRAVVARKRAP